MQRFKAALVTGNWRNNPEPLVRDDNGDFVLYDDAVECLMNWKQSALAKLGAERDSMTTKDVEIVQKFLGV